MDKVKMEARFIDDLKADSLAVVELVLALEENFNIEIPDEDTEQIKSVGDAVSYIQTHQKSIGRNAGSCRLGQTKGRAEPPFSRSAG